LFNLLWSIHLKAIIEHILNIIWALMSEKVLVSWSGGKDSAFALFQLIKQGVYEVFGLLTTITEGENRISMHGVHKELLEEQARVIGFPLIEIALPKACPDQKYGEIMSKVLAKVQNLGVNTVVFGDLYLEDIRNYREEKLAQVNMKGIFPLWGKRTEELAVQFINAGFRAKVVCVDLKVLTKDYVGREYNHEFIADLPKGVDPCGENGEFHTFVYDAPIFKKRVNIKKGKSDFQAGRFYYYDLRL